MRDGVRSRRPTAALAAPWRLAPRSLGSTPLRTLAISGSLRRRCTERPDGGGEEDRFCGSGREPRSSAGGGTELGTAHSSAAARRSRAGRDEHLFAMMSGLSTTADQIVAFVEAHRREPVDVDAVLVLDRP